MAFGALFESAAESMLILASALVGRSDAGDVVQEACVIALRKFNEFEPGTSFRAWMGAIVRHVASNHNRTERRRAARLRLLPTRRPRRMDARALGTIDDALLRAMGTLDETARACLLLRVVREHPYAAIAELLAIPESTARSHVMRARRELLRLMPPGEGGRDA